MASELDVTVAPEWQGEQASDGSTWEEARAPDGSTYYVNHTTRQTSWKPKASLVEDDIGPPPDYAELNAPTGEEVHVAATQQAPVHGLPSAYPAEHKNNQEEAFAPAQPPPLFAGGSTQQQQVTFNSCLTCRGLFWGVAAGGWIVWVFAVAAAGDKNWIEDPSGDGSGVGSGEIEDNCASEIANESACIAYECFVAAQRFATVLCSVAMVLYTVALFRPYEATYGSTKVLGLTGGVIMTFYAFFQLVAFLCADKFIKEHNEEWEDSEFDATLSRGPTYGVGVMAFVFGAIHAITVLVVYRQAGDGPLMPYTKGRPAVAPPHGHQPPAQPSAAPGYASSASV